MGTKAKVINLTCPCPFVYDDESRNTAGVRWTTWIRDLELYMDASNIDHKPQRKAILLHAVGGPSREIYYTKGQPNDDYDATKMCLQNHFSPLVNTDFEIFTFGEMRQRDSESLDDFVVRLRLAAKTCGFANEKVVLAEIKKQLIRGCKSSKLRQHILETPAITLDLILVKSRAGEAAGIQAKTIEQSTCKQERTFKPEPVAAVSSFKSYTNHGEFKNKTDNFRIYSDRK